MGWIDDCQCMRAVQGCDVTLTYAQYLRQLTNDDGRGEEHRPGGVDGSSTGARWMDGWMDG